MLGFKCIGAAHEKPRQQFLEVAEKKLHKEQLNVKVKLRAGPENEKDENAIAIDMDQGTGWFCVGYIASDLIDKVSSPSDIAWKNHGHFSSSHLFQSPFCSQIIYYSMTKTVFMLCLC